MQKIESRYRRRHKSNFHIKGKRDLFLVAAADSIFVLLDFVGQVNPRELIDREASLLLHHLLDIGLLQHGLADRWTVAALVA